MNIFSRGVEPNELYTAEDFLSERPVYEAFNNAEDYPFLTMKLVYSEDQTNLLHKSLHFAKSCYRDGTKIVEQHKNYEEKVKEFFDALGGNLYAIFLDDGRDQLCFQ